MTLTSTKFVFFIVLVQLPWLLWRLEVSIDVYGEKWELSIFVVSLGIFEYYFYMKIGWMVGFFIRSLRQSFRLKFLKCVYLGNHLSETIHIWTKVTHEGWNLAHDFGLLGPCPGAGLEVKI